jgi:HK97 family phage prohead protease
MKMSIIHKTTESSTNGGDFILSDATPDHYDDTIDPNGWDLENFKKNPIALFNHNSDFPIGRWTNLRIEKGALRGRLVMAPEGTSSRIDEIIKLIKCGVLRAVSVGFKPKSSEPRKSGGRHYSAQILVETSLVCIPANPSALLQAKALGVSTATIKMIFKEQNKNASLADRIADARASIKYSEAERMKIHRRAKAKLAGLDTKEAKTQTERADKAMAQARARIAAKKAKQEPSTSAEKYNWPDQDFFIWNGQRIQRNWTKWKEQK